MPPQRCRSRVPAPAAADATIAPAAAKGDEWLAADQEWEEPAAEWDDGEIEFPIADYDELTVDEILPLLPQLYTDELDVVEHRERSGQNRAAIINELQRLRASAADDAEGDYVAEEEDEEEFFPIEDYDELSIREIVDLLRELDNEELAEVRAHEAGNKKRRAILQDIDQRLAPARRRPGRVKKKAAPPPARRAAAPVKKAAAPVKKAAAQKAAAPVSRAPAKKAAAPVRKPAAPVKKAVAPVRSAAAPARKSAAPAKQGLVKKAAAPVKKAAAPVKKAAAPVKKATKKR